MDFRFTKEHMDIRRAVREFAEKEFPTVARECDRNEEFPFEVWKKACDLQLIGCFIPEEYGGAGYGLTEQCCIAEEFWRVDPGCGQCMNSTTIGSECILMFGSEDQKKRYLPGLVKGDAITGIAITEPDAGSDTLSAITSAKRDGKDYLISGGKIFITNGDLANFLIVYCATNPDKPKSKDRYSMLIVETDRKGYSSTKMKDKLGIRASDTSEVHFDDVRVPETNILGQEGTGFACLMSFFNRTRVMVAATGVGLAQGALEKAIWHINRRKQFGKFLSEFQVNKFKIAEMATQIEAARCLTYKAATLYDSGTVDSTVTAMAKWFSGWVAVRCADEALQMHGGYGYMGEYDISRFYRDAKILEIYEGAKEIEKEIISRDVLKRKR